ncbi:MAG: type II toxin-antitoxin system HicB family antitoxin [Trueperaceae bacterium]
MTYPAKFEQADDGITITFRDLTDAISAASSEDEAAHNAAEALDLTLEARLEEGQDIPLPSAIEPGEVLIAPSAGTQAALLVHLARQQRTLSDLARTMGTSWAAVQRLENPKHSPSLRQLERAAAALGKRLILTFE